MGVGICRADVWHIQRHGGLYSEGESLSKCIGGGKEVSNYHDINLGCHAKRSKKATTRGSGCIRYWHAKGGGVHETASRYALVGVGRLVQRVELNCSTCSCDRKSIRHCLMISQVLMRSIMLD